MQVVKRAEDEDLNKNVRYHVSFIKNAQGRVITDVSPCEIPPLTACLSVCNQAYTDSPYLPVPVCPASAQILGCAVGTP